MGKVCSYEGEECTAGPIEESWGFKGLNMFVCFRDGK